MATQRIRVASGVSHLDRLLGGLFIGDNVVWHDEAGTLATAFCLNFIQASLAQGIVLGLRGNIPDDVNTDFVGQTMYG